MPSLLTRATPETRGCVMGGTPSAPMAVIINRNAASAISLGSCARHRRGGCVVVVSSTRAAGVSNGTRWSKDHVGSPKGNRNERL